MLTLLYCRHGENQPEKSPRKKKKSGRPRNKSGRKRTVSSPLAKAWQKALEQLVNTEQWGLWVNPKPRFNPDGKPPRESPKFQIEQEAWDLWPRWCQGERGLQYDNGRWFLPWHVHKTMSPPDIQRMFEGGPKVYYTGKQ